MINSLQMTFSKIRKGLILLFLITALTGFTQEGSDQGFLVGPQGDTVKIELIPISEITVNLDQSNARLKKIDTHLNDMFGLEKFDSLYNRGMQELIRERNSLEEPDAFYSLRSINDKKKQWITYQERVKVWKTRTSDRIQILDNDYFESEIILANWQKTLKHARDGGVPSDVLSTIQDFIQKTERMQRKVIASQNDVLRKQNKLSEISLIIDDVLTFLDTKRENIQADYFQQDSPPLWSSYDTTAQLSFTMSRLKDSIKTNVDGLENFYHSNRKTFILHLVIFLVLWLLYYLLYRQTKKTVPDQDVEYYSTSRAIISHHGLIALTVSLFLTFLIYPAIITIVNDILQFAFLLIGLYLLPKYFSKHLRSLLIWFIVLFFVSEIQLLLSGKLFFSRMSLLVENLLTGWILYKISGKGSLLATQLKIQKKDFILRIVPIFYILLILSFISNLAGFADLGQLLGNAVVDAMINLVMLIVSIMVINRTISILLRTPLFQSSYVIRNHFVNIERRLHQIVQLFAILLWVKYFLTLIGVYTYIADWFGEAIKMSWEVGTTTIELGNIINFILVIFITIMVFRLVRIILKEDVFPRVMLPRGIPGTISTVVTYFIVGYGFFVAIGAAGVDLSQFGLIAGALGVGIGFGLQGIVANFIAGLVLAFERPIQVGDEIQILNMYGVVTSLGVRSTTIRTYDGSEVIVPNSDLITKDVTNWTLSDRKKRREIFVYAAYGTDPHKVMDLMARVAGNHPEVLKVPAPWPLFDGFGENSLNFRIRIWTTIDTGVTVKSDVAIKIYDAMEEAGIQIPFPQRDLHIRTIDPSIAQSGRDLIKSPAKRKPAGGRKGGEK